MMTQPDARAGRDIVERLRSRAWDDRQHRKLREEAAAEIERLRLQLGWRAGLLVMGEDGVPRPLFPHPTGWLPIATAPRDGTPLLAWDGDVQVVAFWVAYMVGGRDRGAWYMANGFNNEWQPCPTHWCPLPAPPEVTP